MDALKWFLRVVLEQVIDQVVGGGFEWLWHIYGLGLPLG